MQCTPPGVVSNLRRCQPIIEEFCRQHDLPYCETSPARVSIENQS
jgi:hypothetical protein